MKVNILKKTDNELKIEVEGAGHAICNLLQKWLLEDENVELAGYDISHPLTPTPIIYVRAKSGLKPEEALLKALKKAQEMNEEFNKALKRALKT